jgi:catechol 2,3-dioxygenase-like lactoylglutathione lyase family enzyme
MILPHGRVREQDHLAAAGRRGHNVHMIGRLEKTVLDCPDPRALAAFYAELLGMRVNEDSADWVVIGRRPGARELAFQRASTWVPPRWPEPEHPQQAHLDIRVDDVDAAEQAALALGARRLTGECGTGFRVFADPVGHPFCLVYGRQPEPARAD